MIVDGFTFLWSAYWLWRIPKQDTQATEEAKAEIVDKPSIWKVLRDDIVVGFRAIANAVRRWQFPVPEASGPVTVSYPFMLQPADL